MIPRFVLAAVVAVSTLFISAGPAMAATSYGPSPEQVFDAYLPSSGSGRPAVILIHGGEWTKGGRGAMSPYAVDLQSRGIVAINMEYRKSSLALWRDLPEDVRLVVDYVKSHAGGFGVNPSRIGLFGFSAGGHLALLGGTSGSGPSSAPHRVKAVAAWAGPSNLIQIVTEEGCPFSPCGGLRVAGNAVQRFEGWCTLLGCYTPPGNPYQVPLNGCGGGAGSCVNRYLATSPVAQVDLTDPPTFLAQAVDDIVVPFEQTVEMAAALSAVLIHVEVKTPLPPNVTGHGLWPVDSPVWGQTATFFQKQL